MFVVLGALQSSCKTDWSRNDLEVGQFAPKRRFMGLDSATVPPATLSFACQLQPRCTWDARLLRHMEGQSDTRSAQPRLCLARFSEDTPCHTGDGLIVAASFSATSLCWRQGCLGGQRGVANCTALHSNALQPCDLVQLSWIARLRGGTLIDLYPLQQFQNCRMH